MRSVILAFVLFLSLLVKGSGSDDNDGRARKEERASARLPPCAACATLVQSFENQLVGGKGGGADGDKALLFDSLCRDVERGEQQCRANLEEWRGSLEEWLQVRPAVESGVDGNSLRRWLCVDRLELCCPEGHFGPDCQKCQAVDDRGRMCSGNGKCKGEGTRKGNGKCACDAGYSGTLCESCDAGFYESYQDEEKHLCSPCHKSCQLHCTGSGAKSCLACRAGYTMDSEHGCVDMDECLVSRPCSANKFCVNVEGAYRCLHCDQACDGCDGDGPDNCHRCAEGYTEQRDTGLCISEQAAGRIFSVSNLRFFTYAGLCVAACIIFQRSVVVAGVLGMVIAVYISFSEYYLMTSSGELKPI